MLSYTMTITRACGAPYSATDESAYFLLEEHIFQSKILGAEGRFSNGRIGAFETDYKYSPRALDRSDCTF